MFLEILKIVAGLVLLAAGGEVLVRGAVGLALRLRVTPAVVGLTVVAAGTSMPELVVSVVAALRGSPDIAIGNVIGSNIFNIGLVLGGCSVFVALPAERKTLQLEWPFLFVVTLAAILVMTNGVIGRSEGLIFIAALVVFFWIMVRLARRDVEAMEAAEVSVAPADGPRPRLAQQMAMVVAGGVLLWLGGHLVVVGASAVALDVGISERVVGLTVVAMGTSLPELVSSLAAALRGRTDVAVGNIIGSSIFNLLGILGVGSLLMPMTVDRRFMTADVWWMLAFTVLLVPVLYSGRRRVSRTDGVVLLGLFVVYMGFVLLVRNGAAPGTP